MSALPRRLRARTPSPSHPDNPVLMRHQSFIRSLPCLACGKPAPSECAYVGMLAGLGLPSTEHYLLPLCGPATVWQDCCHSRKHYRGAARFWSGLGIDPLDLASQLWRVSGNVTAGLRALMRARQAAAYQRWVRRGGKEGSPRSSLDRGAALRDRLRPTAMVIPPMSSELPLLVESRS
jgi:hypothetical protein